MKNILRYGYKCVMFVWVGLGVLLETGFNRNTGYFYYLKIMNRNNEPNIVYVICKGHRFLWLNAYDIIEVVFNRDDLNEVIVNMGVEVIWKQK